MRARLRGPCIDSGDGLELALEESRTCAFILSLSLTLGIFTPVRASSSSIPSPMSATAHEEKSAHLQRTDVVRSLALHARPPCISGARSPHLTFFLPIV
jgi:hypothetical protein